MQENGRLSCQQCSETFYFRLVAVSLWWNNTFSKCCSRHCSFTTSPQTLLFYFHHYVSGTVACLTYMHPVKSHVLQHQHWAPAIVFSYHMFLSLCLVRVWLTEITQNALVVLTSPSCPAGVTWNCEVKVSREDYEPLVVSFLLSRSISRGEQSTV